MHIDKVVVVLCPWQKKTLYQCNSYRQCDAIHVGRGECLSALVMRRVVCGKEVAADDGWEVKCVTNLHAIVNLFVMGYSEHHQTLAIHMVHVEHVRL